MQSTHYTLHHENFKDSPLTLAVVADLHEHNPAQALAILRKEHPDVIAVPGDLFERRPFGKNAFKIETKSVMSFAYSLFRPIDRMFDPIKRKLKDAKTEHSYTFLREAAKIAPVVISLGNHEMFLTKKDEQVIRENGVTLLNNSSTEIKGVLFGGIPSMQGSGRIDMDFLQEFGSADQYKILLCHHPEYFPWTAFYADLVLAGHCHGGQIRVRGKGLFAPGQGWFPKYHHGLFSLKKKGRVAKMIVSAGCANTAMVPRWGNPEEVVILTIYRTPQGLS